jgi:hypothetical protein
MMVENLKWTSPVRCHGIIWGLSEFVMQAIMFECAAIPTGKC